jgi:hypothetical protein
MNFKIDKTKLDSYSKETLEFILNEGKDYLDYTLNESDKITNRAFSFILLLFAILSGVVAYTFNKIILVEYKNIICLNFCLIFTLVILLFHLGCLIFIRPIMAKGRLPKTIALSKYLIIPKVSKEQNYVVFIIQEIENVQQKIDFNLTKNKKRQDKLSFVLITIAIISVLYLIFGFFIII